MRNLFFSILISFMASSFGQEISIPDPGLNAAIRDALLKPVGPLTQQDLLSLTALEAVKRNISDLSGLEAARNLSALSLQSNRLANLTIPNSLTNLTNIDLSFNPLTNCFFPDGLKSLTRVVIQYAQLTNIVLPADLSNLNELYLDANQLRAFKVPANLTRLGFLSLNANRLTDLNFLTNLSELNSLDAELNQLSAFELPPRLTNISFLDIGFNALTNCVLPNGMTRLDTLILEANQLTNINLPASMGGLMSLDLSDNRFTSLAIPAGMTNLLSLNLFYNQLTNVTFPGDLQNLTTLDLDNNQFASLELPPNLARLSFLHLRSNQLTGFVVPAELTALTYLDVGENQLSKINLPVTLGHLAYLRLSGNQLVNLALPVGLTNLVSIYLRTNQLTSLTLPSDLGQLVSIDVLVNQITNIVLPAGLTNLTSLFLSGNQLTRLTLPPDMTNVASLVLNGNPFQILVLPEPLAEGNLAETVASLRNDGISVFPYKTDVSLVLPRPSVTGGFEFTILGPPGNYTALGSDDLSTWTVLGDATNDLGSAVFIDAAPNTLSQKYYRALLEGPPADMVFIPANTFTMGSPVTEQDRASDEGPQTIVTLSHGFWIGKFEITQKEYLAVMGTNPSAFTGDLSRPISSMSWPDATNYCWKLTQVERAAGRISGRSQFRLPTEAEWECAARAGTTTRFSYGDDPDYSSLTNHAWFAAFSPLTVIPVGQKLPNPWGLYDMEGNVWEFCQDWYGPLPGGSVVDPKGAPSNQIGLKVMRGGAFDYFDSDCRSARRLYFGNHPALTDWDLGFRVVLATEP